MLRDPELLHALKTSSTIKDVSILFASQYLDDPEDAMNCSIPLEGFKNLTSLELYNFFGNPESLIPDLVDALGECPGLKTLGLSSGCDYDCENLPEALLIDDEEDFDFLHKICENYGSRSRLSPLALDTLRLGQGMYIFDSSIMHPVVKNQGKYLPKLVQIETLKNLHLFNGLLKEDVYDDPEPLEVDWSQLEGCKSLQKLSVSIFDEEVLDWLNTSGNSVQDFIVTQHYSMYDKDLDNYKFLCLPQLSMISLREMMVSKRDGDDAWSDTDSSITDFSEPENGSEAETKSRAKISPKSPTLPKAGSPSEAETTLDAESMSELEYPSGARIPYLELDRSTITVLDRLSDHGAQLTRLGICIDLETQWVSDSRLVGLNANFSKAQFSSHLPQLQRLTQLRLDGKSYCTGQYPTKASSLWPGVETSKDIAYHYAILIHSKCPSLQYINIEYCAWQVLYQKLTNGDMATDFVSLRPLDPDEVVSIELFALGNFRSENGLPMSERSGTPPSDEQLNRAQRYSDELEVARREGKLSPGTEKYLCH